jgi:hypothetical protein
MKKAILVIMGILSASCFASGNVASPMTATNPPTHDSTGFVQSMTGIQANYDEMYRSLPLDQQNKVQNAAMSMENIRLSSPLDAQALISTQKDRAELSMKSVVSQMAVSDAVKIQIDNARHEINQRLSEKILDLKARRAAHP